MDRKALTLTLACFSLITATSFAKDMELYKKAKDAYNHNNCTSAIKLLNDYKAGGLSTSEVMNVDAAINWCEQYISGQRVAVRITGILPPPSAEENKPVLEE